MRAKERPELPVTGAAGKGRPQVGVAAGGTDGAVPGAGSVPLCGILVTNAVIKSELLASRLQDWGQYPGASEIAL